MLTYVSDDACSKLDPQAEVRNPSRLEAVSRVELLDSPPEESFDRLTKLATKLIGVPATFISLVDQDRDYYKSCFGFTGSLATTRQLQAALFVIIRSLLQILY